MNNDHIEHLKPAFLCHRWEICCLPSIPISSLGRYPDNLWLGHHRYSLTCHYDNVWFMVQYSSPHQVGMLKYHIWKSSRFICAVKVQMYPGQEHLAWVGNKLLVHLHHCEENGFGERSSSVQRYEHPGKDPDISLCGHDRCLHRPCCHLLHWQSWLFYSCRRWVCILKKNALYSILIPPCIWGTIL